jgi:hypothetical protein
MGGRGAKESNMFDARATRATALAVAALTVAVPAAAAQPSREPATRHSLTPAVDARHQALIARHDAGVSRTPGIREAATRASGTTALPSGGSRAVRQAPDGGLDWGDVLLAAGSVLGIGLVTGGAALGLVHARTRVGHQAS